MQIMEAQTETNPNLLNNKENQIAVEEDANPLPRSVVRRNVYELLDGEWKFEIDLEDRGLSETWFLGHEYSATAVWPGSIEAHMSSAKDAQQLTPPWQDSVVAWYEREFMLPERNGRTDDSLLQITFGACGYETRVWLNGHPLQTIEGEEVHFGE